MVISPFSIKDDLMIADSILGKSEKRSFSSLRSQAYSLKPTAYSLISRLLAVFPQVQDTKTRVNP
jgi:hypothetical protein